MAAELAPICYHLPVDRPLLGLVGCLDTWKRLHPGTPCDLLLSEAQEAIGQVWVTIIPHIPVWVTGRITDPLEVWACASGTAEQTAASLQP